MTRKRRKTKATTAQPRKWESYEEVARYLLTQFADHFGLQTVEEKHEIVGLESGTTWEIDGKAIKKGSAGFLIVECRRWKKDRQTQENVAAVAYRIIDTGADGGIIVSPLGIQKGGKKVAKARNITEVKLNEDASSLEYVMSFLDRVMAADVVRQQPKIEAVIERKMPNGSITTEHKVIYDPSEES